MFFQIRALPVWDSWNLYVDFCSIYMVLSRCEVLVVPFVFSKFSKTGIESGFRLPLSLVTGKNFLHGTCAKWSNEYSGTKNYLLFCSHLKFRYFNFRDVFSQRSQSHSFLSHLDVSRRLKKKLHKMADLRL